MRIYRIILPVGNIQDAQRFYSALFQQEGERVSKGRHYFKIGDVILACYDPKADGDDASPKWKKHANEYIYFSVNNLEEIYSRLSQLRIKPTVIDTMPWGERLFYASDPWGNNLCFVDNETLFLGSN